MTEQTGLTAGHHFAGAGNPITACRRAVQVVSECAPTRFGAALRVAAASTGARSSPWPAGSTLRAVARASMW